jgi:hypothetical protein
MLESMTFRTMALVGLLGLGSSACFGQFETSEVLGTVTDTSQKPVARALVTLLNQDTGIAAKTTTDDSGSYDFFNVRVGRYTITVELAGFSKVSEQASVIETDTSEHSQVIGTQAIVELPLNGRHYASLALLATNVHVSPIGHFVFAQRHAARRRLQRQRHAQHLQQLPDGRRGQQLLRHQQPELFEPGGAALARRVGRVPRHHQQLQRGVRTRRRRRRQRGDAVGNQRQFHGTAYEFLRNTDLNAIGYIFGARPPNFVKPTLHRNQFGVTIGGPSSRTSCSSSGL